MSLTLSNAARSAAADAVVDLVDGGTPPALIRVYGGTRAAGPGTTTAETLLAEFTCANPAFGASANGVATLDTTPVLTATGAAAGTATWFRIVVGGTAAGGAGVIDGKVTATGGGGDLEMNTTTVSVGLDLEITSGTVTMPAGTAD
jgi:hypothetical protein